MPKMNRETVVRTVTENYDRLIERLRNELANLKSADVYAAKVESWRDVCADMVSELHARIEKGIATDGELSKFKLPEQPDKPREYEIGRKDRELQNAVARKESALHYLEARVAEDDGSVNFTTAELSHVGFSAS